LIAASRFMNPPGRNLS